MNKKLLFALLGLSAALSLSSFSTFAEEETEISEESQDLDPITPSDYLSSIASEAVTLGDLDSLSATEYTYEISDDMLQEEIDYELMYMAEETEVDRASEDGDIIYVTLSYTVGGESDEMSTYFYLGDEEFGEEFDSYLTGVYAGDELSFEITFTEDDGDYYMIEDEWVGETVTFTVDVESVCETSTPEYNDEFVSENYGYDTVEEFEEAYREYLQASYDEMSASDVYDALISAVLDGATISEMDEELYASCEEELLSDYGSYLGTTELVDILDAFGMDEDDWDAEVQDLAERRMVISYLVEYYGVEVTEEDYVDYVYDFASDYGYEEYLAEFESIMVRSYLVWSLYEEQVSAILYDNAEITQETMDASSYYDYDYDWEDETEE